MLEDVSHDLLAALLCLEHGGRHICSTCCHWRLEAISDVLVLYCCRRRLEADMEIHLLPDVLLLPTEAGGQHGDPPA